MISLPIFTTRSCPLYFNIPANSMAKKTPIHLPLPFQHSLMDFTSFPARLALCSLKRAAAEAGGARIGGTCRVAGLSRTGPLSPGSLSLARMKKRHGAYRHVGSTGRVVFGFAL